MILSPYYMLPAYHLVKIVAMVTIVELEFKEDVRDKESAEDSPWTGEDDRWTEEMIDGREKIVDGRKKIVD